MATTQTPSTTGEAQVIHVASVYGGAVQAKMAKVNRKLAKQGLGQCKILSVEPTKVYVHVDGEDVLVPGYCFAISVPFLSKKIEGHTLIGTMEELGKGQRMMSPIATALEQEPQFPGNARFDELDHLIYETENATVADHREYRELQAARDEFYRTVIAPLYEAKKNANGAKIETLRESAMGCVHCNTNRARKSVLVFEKDNGELVMVGRACAKEYFGVDLNAALSVSNDLLGSEEEHYGHYAQGFSHDAYRRQFSMVYWLVKNYGYVSPKVEDSYNTQIGFVPADTLLATRKSTRTMVYDIEKLAYDFIMHVNREDFMRATDPSAEVRSTLHAEVVQGILAGVENCSARAMQLRTLQGLHERNFDFTGNTEDKHYAINYFRWIYTHEDEMAQALVDCMGFWNNVESTDTFMLNCKAVALAEANKSVGMTGMVVLKWLESREEVKKGSYFVPAHRRMFPKDPTQKYLAPKGEMVNVTFTVTRKMMGGYDDAPWFLIVGRTAENLEVKLFAKKDMFDEAKEGEELKLRAKVKSHDLYKGSMSTALYYAKLV